MKKILALAGTLYVATFPLTVHAGVEMDMATRNASGTVTENMKIYAQSGAIRMEQVAGGDDTTMIFRNNEFLIVNHAEKNYMVMDEAMLAQVSDQISAAMKEMEAQLAGMPAEQRAMVEQMMKGQMGAMMGGAKDAPPPPRVEAIGRGEWQSKKCQQFAVYEQDVKTQQVCAADLDDIDGSEEMMIAFRDMATFMVKLTESLPMGKDKITNPVELMNQIGGFPVRTIEYEGSKVARESTLESVTEKDLDASLFEPPKGYRRSDPMMGR